MQSLCRDGLCYAGLKAAVDGELLFYHFYVWIVSGIDSIVMESFIDIDL